MIIKAGNSIDKSQTNYIEFSYSCIGFECWKVPGPGKVRPLLDRKEHIQHC